MSKVITFSRVFPSYHPKKGQPTYFVEKIWKCLMETSKGYDPSDGYQDEHDNHFHPMGDGLKNVHQFNPKYHTIRAGKRWKVGDKFSPRVWGNDVNPKSGKSGPYHSKQIIIAPDIEIKKVFDLKFQLISRPFVTFKNEKGYDTSYPEGTFYKMAINDGFDNIEDLESWLLGNKPMCNTVFVGQIICWNENINY